MPTTDYQRAFLETYPPSRVFAVVSWGCAGTAWIARMLNSHPDIFCVHAANTFWYVLGGAPLPKPVEYLRLIGSQGHAHRLAGDVHGVSRLDIPQVRQEFGDRFAATVVVRDPLPRLRSLLAHLDRFQDQFACDEAYAGFLCDRARVNPGEASRDLLRKLHGVNMLNAVTEEQAVGPIYRLEDLGSSPSHIRQFVATLSGGTVDCPADWLERAILAPKVNSHVSDQQPTFTQMDIDLIRRMVTAEAWEIYRSLGYVGCP